MTQVGMIDGELIINPSQEQWDKGDLKMTVASTSTEGYHDRSRCKRSSGSNCSGSYL